VAIVNFYSRQQGVEGYGFPKDENAFAGDFLSVCRD
jgi:hypothetical protein